MKLGGRRRRDASDPTLGHLPDAVRLRETSAVGFNEIGPSDDDFKTEQAPGKLAQTACQSYERAQPQPKKVKATPSGHRLQRVPSIQRFA